MTNNTNTPDTSTMTHLERIAYFSAAREEIVPLDRPARRLPPRARRHSIRHRAIR